MQRVLAVCWLCGMPARGLAPSVRYADGLRSVHPEDWTSGPPEGERIWLVRADPTIARLVRAGSWTNQSRLADRVAELVAQRAPEVAGHRYNGRMGSFIVRTPGADGRGYTSNTVHRDLDELAVDNLRKEGCSLFFNAWLPLAPVERDPIGLVVPSSVGLEQVDSYHPALPADRTGLRYSPGHRWGWCGRMGAGDALLWESSSVWHASLEGEAEGAARQSVDLRVYFEPATSRRGKDA